MKPIKVWVIDYGRPSLVLQWIDPSTGKRRTQTAGTAKKRDAHLAAADLERKLNARHQTDGTATFADFVEIYTFEHLHSLSAASMKKSLSVLGLYESEMDPQTLADVNAVNLSLYCARSRSAGRSESTIATHLKTIKAALSWGKQSGFLHDLPAFPRITRSKDSRAKGRPLTHGEFVKMLRAVPMVTGRDLARPWRTLLIGLWLSGLRLEEALNLRWDDRTAQLSLDTMGKIPLLTIREQKSQRAQTMPITPDFGRWVLRRRRDPSGFVFPLSKLRYRDVRNVNATSKTISAIGEAAGIVVNEGTEKKKYASAHDLRRSFGLRWSARLMPAELKQLMRHADIATTMKFYAIADALSFGERLWK